MIPGNIWALVPARAGSKRLPQKNIRSFNGKPLIEWTFEAAKNSKYISKTFLSSDSEEIADIARKNKIEVPFLREDHLASDLATMTDVITDFWNRCDPTNEVDTLVLLQPTSPLRTSADIDQAIELYFSKNALSVTSVCEAHPGPDWMNTLPEDLSMENFIKPELQDRRSQDLGKFYQLNGAIYIFDRKNFFNEKKVIASSRSYAFIMDKYHSVDIDTNLDFKIAECIMKG